MAFAYDFGELMTLGVIDDNCDPHSELSEDANATLAQKWRDMGIPQAALAVAHIAYLHPLNVCTHVVVCNVVVLIMSCIP